MFILCWRSPRRPVAVAGELRGRARRSELHAQLGPGSAFGRTGLGKAVHASDQRGLMRLQAGTPKTRSPTNNRAGRTQPACQAARAPGCCAFAGHRVGAGPPGMGHAGGQQVQTARTSARRQIGMAMRRALKGICVISRTRLGAEDGRVPVHDGAIAAGGVVDLPGWALAYAISSPTVLTGSELVTNGTLGASAHMGPRA